VARSPADTRCCGARLASWQHNAPGGLAGHSGWSPRALTRDRMAIRFPCWWSNRPRGLMCAPLRHAWPQRLRGSPSCLLLFSPCGGEWAQARADRTYRAVSGRHLAWTGGQLVLQNLARLSKDSATADCGTDANKANRPLARCHVSVARRRGLGVRLRPNRWTTPCASRDRPDGRPGPESLHENNVQGLEPNRALAKQPADLRPYSGL
jgi:hypothetical protein